MDKQAARLRSLSAVLLQEGGQGPGTDYSFYIGVVSVRSKDKVNFDKFKIPTEIFLHFKFWKWQN